MKKLSLLFLSILLIGCMSPEERRIKDYLNNKLKSEAQKASDVEIISEDSVLSLIPIQWMYNECLKDASNSDVFFKLCQYFYEVSYVRSLMTTGEKKTKELISKHSDDWRRIVNVKVKAQDGHISDNIEVIFDIDNTTPMMVGHEYDTDLNLWRYKIESLPQSRR